MPAFRFLVPFALLMLSCGACQALTLSEALREAASNPALLQSRLGTDQAAAAAEDAGARGPDEIAFEAENVGGRLPGMSQAELTLSFKRPLPDRRKTSAQKRLAALSVDAAKLDEAAVERDIRNRVMAAFHLVIGLQNLLRNAGELSRIGRDMCEAARMRVEAGSSPEQELVEARLEAERVELDRSTLEGQVSEAMLALFREMGKPPEADRELVGTLSLDLGLPPLDELRRTMFERHPALRSAGLKVEENGAGLALLNAETRPSYAWVAGARNFRETGEHAWVFGIEAELPHARSNRGARKAARVEISKIAAGQEKIRRELSAQLEELVRRFERVKATAVRLHDEITPTAAKALEMALDGYRLGKTGQAIVLEARKTHAEVTGQALSALLEMHQAADAIESLTGADLVRERP
ncbi:MAG TPA: TolC family protein [Candidatus Ozemobacteraceae bacterium]|nr:TolC family protein [Candidatus Ozemobacteraceae bacterium]